MIWLLQPPQHLDGVDDADVSVGKVVEATKGEGGENPDQAGMIITEFEREDQRVYR